MFRSLKREWGPKISSMIPLDLWHRLVDVELLLPYYHLVGDQELEHVSGLFKFRTVQQFKADIEFFMRYYTPVTLGDIIRHLEGGTRLPKRSFLLTFDDGFSEIYDVVAPILYTYGIPAAFFLTTSVIDNHELCYQQKISLLIRSLRSVGGASVNKEASQLLDNAGVSGHDLRSRILNLTYRQRNVLDHLGPILECDFATFAASVQPYLTSAQIRKLLEQGFAIGAHSIDHPLYSELSLDEQLRQTSESLNWLSNRFDYDCQAFAFPFRDVGVSPEFFQLAFSSGSLKVSFGTGGMHRHYFPRNLTRNTMENTNHNAQQILAREFSVTLLRRSPYTSLKP